MVNSENPYYTDSTEKDLSKESSLNSVKIESDGVDGDDGQVSFERRTMFAKFRFLRLYGS